VRNRSKVSRTKPAHAGEAIERTADQDRHGRDNEPTAKSRADDVTKAEPGEAAAVERQGSWLGTIFLARRTARAMHAVRQDVERKNSDGNFKNPQWANARENPACALLLQEAQLLEQLWSLFVKGLEAANISADAPAGAVFSNKRTLHYATKAAKRVVGKLGAHLPYMLPEHAKLGQEQTEAREVQICVDAWKEVLHFISEAAPRNRARSKVDVEDALVRLADEKPELYQRARVADAIKKNRSHVLKIVLSEIAEADDPDDPKGEEAPREKAFALTRLVQRWSHGKNPHHLYDFAKALERDMPKIEVQAHVLGSADKPRK
jgi:hypothetical protein